ncbi:MAG: biopolymer transporter ExbD [Firmicutes bacterium]|nr:biopolymer transporter ExbD [Bacillota bacterium]
MNFYRSRRRNPQPNIVPLIDIMFFLVTFFMVFANFYQSSMGMEVELPEAVTGNPQENIQLEVVVDRDGIFYLEGKVVTGPEIQAIVREAVKTDPNTFVIVKGDKHADYNSIIRAADYIRAGGVEKFGLGTTEPVR